jgi:hypothetical protein
LRGAPDGVKSRNSSTSRLIPTQNFERRASPSTDPASAPALARHGAEWAGDENAAARAAAQAFNLACACFGLGRCLNDIEKSRVVLTMERVAIGLVREEAMAAVTALAGKVEFSRAKSDNTVSVVHQSAGKTADARGEFLQAARKCADRTRKRSADVTEAARAVATARWARS